MSEVPFYTGDNIPLKFTISDKDGVVNPSVAVVWCIKPSSRDYSELGNATIDGNEVSYTVGTGCTGEVGIYKFYFIMTIPAGQRTHKIEKEVIHNP